MIDYAVTKNFHGTNIGQSSFRTIYNKVYSPNFVENASEISIYPKPFSFVGVI